MNKLLSVSIFLSFLCTTVAGLASNAPTVLSTGPWINRWGYADIVKLIEDRKSNHNPVKSIDELLRLLPQNARENFTFIYSEPPASQDASPEFPRAIVFNGHMIFTFNGSPKQNGFNSLEVADFNPDSRKFTFHEISSPEDGTPGELAYTPVEATSGKCVGCHGMDPKPIWNEYSSWTGIYGTEDDFPTGTEKTNFKQFRQMVDSHPDLRYNALFFRKGSAVSPYEDKNDDNGKFRVNLLFTRILARENAQRLARMIESSPNFSALRDVVLLNLVREVIGADCGDSDTNSYMFITQLNLRIYNEVQRLGLNGTYHSPLGETLALMGINPENFSLSREKPNFFFSDGGTDQETLLLGVLYKDMVAQDQLASDSTLAGIFSDDSYSLKDQYKDNSLYPFADTLVTPLKPRISSEACNTLINRARGETSGNWNLVKPAELAQEPAISTQN